MSDAANPGHLHYPQRLRGCHSYGSDLCLWWCLSFNTNLHADGHSSTNHSFEFLTIEDAHQQYTHVHLFHRVAREHSDVHSSRCTRANIDDVFLQSSIGSVVVSWKILSHLWNISVRSRRTRRTDCRTQSAYVTGYFGEYFNHPRFCIEQEWTDAGHISSQWHLVQSLLDHSTIDFLEKRTRSIGLSLVFLFQWYLNRLFSKIYIRMTESLVVVVCFINLYYRRQ